MSFDEAERPGLFALGTAGGERYNRFMRRVDGDYKPGNCRWATYAEQNRNKRSTKIRVEDVAVIVSLAKSGESNQQIATRFGVSSHTISQLVAGATDV